MTQAPRSGLWMILGWIVSSFALAETAYTTKTVNLRAGPSREYPVVVQIPPDTPVSVAGCVDDWTWCDVIAGPDRGWVYAGNLVYPYQNRRVLIISDGPYIGLPIVVFSIGPYWDAYYRGRPWYSRRSYWINRPPPPRGPSVVRQQPQPSSSRPQAARPAGPRPESGRAQAVRPPPPPARPRGARPQGDRPRPQPPRSKPEEKPR